MFELDTETSTANQL